LQPGDESLQEIFELVSRVLSRLFVGLWPKKNTDEVRCNGDDDGDDLPSP
jgi:hypothetical protein